MFRGPEDTSRVKRRDVNYLNVGTSIIVGVSVPCALQAHGLIVQSLKKSHLGPVPYTVEALAW